MQTNSVTVNVMFWLLRVAVYVAIAYGLGFLMGSFTDVPAVITGVVIGAIFVSVWLWRERRSVARAEA
ncbi:hypothetical protein CWE12_00870 [Aliidiomarina sedimenti]|uniref:DUF4229 domain-containing protein n=1 Tax=Aliidiomarina sedimenti TaxID=1933879 RepID=A0ABY0C1B0_9GAMM|nr:hypothetical protein [Aliidiomarina sedimenti]RUO31582.1 hypothetical protein CWE12_00870 [Aliidiomarina sedimenti]